MRHRESQVGDAGFEVVHEARDRAVVFAAVVGDDAGRESAQAMLGKSASVGEVARITGLTRQTVYRIKDDPAGAEAALATWGM